MCSETLVQRKKTFSNILLIIHYHVARDFFERHQIKHKILNSVFLKCFSNTFQYSFVFLHTIYRNDVRNEFNSGMFKTEKIFKNILQIEN